MKSETEQSPTVCFIFFHKVWIEIMHTQSLFLSEAEHLLPLKVQSTNFAHEGQLSCHEDYNSACENSCTVSAEGLVAATQSAREMILITWIAMIIYFIIISEQHLS